MQYSIRAAVGIAALFLAGCANVAISHIPFQPEPVQQKKLAVFLDGTANDEGSHTNIAKLHNLVTLQASDRISTSYIKGVGVDGKVIGMAMGWGIGEDVRQAYRYLAENYRADKNDEIYIFGFSRGAYAARILAALINVAGIPDVSAIKDEKERIRYVEAIYDAYKINHASVAERRERVQQVLKTPYRPVRIKFMGIWDTVEALGVPDYKEDTGVPNDRYADQLCNIDHAAHALSIDDDRARIFTPILLTYKHLIKECPNVKLNDVVTEVWFSGAHADVGGGYANTDISGISLNWMIGQIRAAEGPSGAVDSLLPAGAAVYGDFAGRTHDPESGLWGLIYHKMNRNIPGYMADKNYLGGKLKIHKSVIDRLAKCAVQTHESHWFDAPEYAGCFSKEEIPDGKKKKTVHKFKGEQSCSAVEVVRTGYNDVHVAKCGNETEEPDEAEGT